MAAKPGYFNDLAVVAFVAVAMSLAAGSTIGARAASEDKPVVHQQRQAPRTSIAALGHARAVSWISTGHISATP